MRYAMLLVLLLGLGGCAGPKPTEIDKDIEIAKVKEKSKCVASRAEVDKAKADALGKLQDPRDIALVSMAEALKDVANKDKKDECDMGMGFQEARRDIAVSQNQTIDSAGGKLASATVTGLVATEGGKTLREAIKNTGSKNQTNIQGNDNKVESKSEDSRTNTTTTNTASGENSPANTTTTSTATGATPASGGIKGDSGLGAAISACGPATHTQGQVAVCLSQAGYDVNIEHGITYVNGSPISGVTYAPAAGE